MRVTFVCGQAEDTWTASYDAIIAPSSSGTALVGIGLDSTTAKVGTTGFAPAGGTTTSTRAAATATVAGLHFLSALEYTVAGTMTGYGQGSSGAQSGLNWSGRF